MRASGRSSSKEKTVTPRPTSLTTVALAAALATFCAPAVGFAQVQTPPASSAEDHNAHHPGAAAEPAAPPDGPAKAQPGGTPGMMGPGGRMGMMGDMKQMMPMMRNMMTMMGAQSGMMAANVEGRIASLKTELKITDAQAPQWNRFADALRATAKSMNGMLEQMMSSGTAATLPERLQRHEKMLSAHLNELRTLKEAVDPLYVVLSNDQKKTADQLMIGPMGMM
jgi:LTXXQ motif family protein